MIRALVFDLDDTLFPEREFVQSGFRAVDEWLRNNRSVRGFQDIATAEFSAGVRGNTFNRALHRLGMLDDPALVRQLVEVYRDHIPQIRLFPDAEWALDYFAKTRQLGLITDGYLMVQQGKVAALGVAERFAAIVYTDIFGREGWKPSPLPYERITEELGCAPSECAYVGDNPAKDFITAKRLNWFTIRIRRPCGEHSAVHLDKAQEADTQIENLFELEATLERHSRITFGQ